MADIKQAAKWLQEGRTVRQLPTDEPIPSGYKWAESLKLDSKGFIVCTCHGQRVPFRPSAFLRDDWEIAEQ